MNKTRKRNNVILIAIIVLSVAILIFYKSFDLKNDDQHSSHLQFYYKEHFLSQTLISIIPNGNFETLLNIQNEKFLGLSKRSTHGYSIEHVTNRIIHDTLFTVNKNERHIIGIIDSPKVNNVIVKDEQNNILPIFFISETNPTPQNYFTPIDSKQYFVIPDVSNRLTITLLDNNGDDIEHYSWAFQ